MKSRFSGFLGLLTVLFVGAQAVSAAFSVNTTHIFSTSSDLDRKFVVTVNFGSTAHTETFNLTCAYTTDAGAQWWIYDTDRMSNAPTTAEWNAGSPGWYFTTPGATGGQATTNYTTPSYSGVHQFVILFYPRPATTTPAPVFPDSITITVDNGTGAGTATGAASNCDDSLQLGIGTSGLSAAYVQTRHSTAYMEALLGDPADELSFDFSVNFGPTPVTATVSLWGYNFTAAQHGLTGAGGTFQAEMHDLNAGGGSSPQGTISVGDGIEGITAQYTTASLSGQQNFRVIVRGASGFQADDLAIFFLSVRTPLSFPQVPAAPAPAPTPVAITPGGSAISTPTLLTASGGSGTPSYTWSITSGTAATISPATGTTSTLTPTGTGSVTVRATNGTTGEWAEETYTVGGGGGGSPTITGPATIPDGVENVAYGPVTIVATGGTPPYTWSATGLPTGVTIAAGTGVISGIPTVNGAFASIVVTVTDSAAQTDVQNYSITIAAAGSVIISTSALPGGQVPNAYSQNVVAVGGTAPYAWSITAGTLPTGLTLGSSTSSTVAISGVPSAAGTFNFTIRVDENGGNFAPRALSITIAPASGTGSGVGKSGSGSSGCASGTGNGAWWLLAVGMVGGFALYRRRKTA